MKERILAVRECAELPDYAAFDYDRCGSIDLRHFDHLRQQTRRRVAEQLVEQLVSGGFLTETLEASPTRYSRVLRIEGKLRLC